MAEYQNFSFFLDLMVSVYTHEGQHRQTNGALYQRGISNPKSSPPWGPISLTKNHLQSREPTEWLMSSLVRQQHGISLLSRSPEVRLVQHPWILL